MLNTIKTHMHQINMRLSPDTASSSVKKTPPGTHSAPQRADCIRIKHSASSDFKSRDIILPTKVRLVKAMVFPVVMYGCESWTTKKTERRRIDAFEL